ncbi:hypothetical protein ACFVFS_29915 [Kitasatospora sp. NPDC057692]|uniref:hypothetical protein n=1 Tax=Kitasatospora sp. NPDC057692 TaxID=3346215 RepID=UPI0036CE5639
MKQIVPKSRWGKISAGGILVVLLAGLSLWNLPLAAQWRDGGRGEGLLLEAPPKAESWERSPDKDPGAPFMRGLDKRVKRLFVQDTSDPLVANFAQTVMEFDSPTWAWLVFRDGSPDKRYARYGNVERIEGIGVPGVDEQRYFCLRVDEGQPCDRRYGWLRYGQYLIEVEVVGRMSEEDSLRMLKDSVAGIGAAAHGI